MKSLLVTFLNKSKLNSLHTVKSFQVLQSYTNGYI